MKRPVLLAVCLGFVPFFSQNALAQARPKTQWGLSGSVTPKFYMWSSITDGVKQHTMSGRELTFGFVRGRVDGGDWGVSFVHKSFREGGSFTHTFDSCFDPNGPHCQQSETFTLHGVSITGVVVHWYKPLLTVRRRVQLWISVALGPGRTVGTIDKAVDGFVGQGFPLVLTPIHTFQNRPVTEDDLPAIFPLVRAEAAGAVILGRAFKIKIAGGLNFPSVRSFRVEGIYFFQ